MAKIVPPKSLTTAQKRSFGRLAAQLAERGIDAEQRRDLLGDYVVAGDRIDDLRERELAATGAERLATSRALTVAVAERRRLHQQVFEGARPVALIPTDAEALATDRQTAADAAWRAYFESLTGLRGGRDDTKIAEADRVGKELEARHGPPSWAVLLDPPSARFIAEQPDDGDDAWGKVG